MRANILRVCALAWLATAGCLGSLRAQDGLAVPQKKSVLLEEYTGMGCGNCPDGAKVASVLKDIAGNRFHIIAVHAGHYAEPAAGYPDYRTEFGQALLDSAGDIGFPCGSVNRHQYEGNTLNMYRGSWTKTTKAVLEEDAPVNLSVQAEVDAKTRRLQVEVRYCFMQDLTDDFALLNVALVQNHIVGYQNGGGAAYDHNHMLRHLLTGQWGDTLHQSTKGEIFSKQYGYTLPDSINSVFVDVRNLEVVAFVTGTEGKEVMNVTAANPRIDNLKEDPKVSLAAVDLPASRYGYDFVDVSLRNFCNDTLKTLSFAATVNEKDVAASIGAQIPPYQTQTVRVHLNEFPIENNNTVSLRLTAVNGKSIETEAVEYAFSAPITVADGTLYLEMSTDLWGDEASVSVNDRRGEAVWSKGPFKAGEQTVLHDTIVLEPGFYAVEFKDYWRDGWMVSPKGSFKLRTADGTLLGQNYSVQNAGDVVFLEVTDGGSSVANQKTESVGSRLAVRALGEGFEILNPDGVELQGVQVFSINGTCLYRQALHTNTGTVVTFLPKSTQMCVVGIRTAAGTEYKKLIK
ncbi:MAG: Omp28-related outer membrane protein [Bacteroides sp.]|nr:Omp28-related outer membrane protein [Ruminococcus flavefaciens]MCM1554981.1 Omp28-related outer membrane protein [Bacteroides sp.]